VFVWSFLRVPGAATRGNGFSKEGRIGPNKIRGNEKIDLNGADADLGDPGLVAGLGRISCRPLKRRCPRGILGGGGRKGDVLKNLEGYAGRRSKGTQNNRIRQNKNKKKKKETKRTGRLGGRVRGGGRWSWGGESRSKGGRRSRPGLVRFLTLACQKEVAAIQKNSEGGMVGVFSRKTSEAVPPFATENERDLGSFKTAGGKASMRHVLTQEDWGLTANELAEIN